jgi:diguanylate cyclase (GGDEF)-like protein
LVDRTPAEALARAGATLTAALLAPAAVAVLRLFPPLSVAAPGAPGWLPIGLATLAAVSLGVAASLRLADGFRTGGGAAMLESAAFACLAVGLAAADFHAIDAPATFADGGMPLAMAACGVLLLAARLLPPFVLTQRGRRVAFVLLAITVEAVLAACLFAPMPAELAPWFAAGAGALAAAAAVPGPVLGVAVLAGAFAAMTAMRPGALDAAFPLAAMLAAGVMLSWPRVRTVAMATQPAQPMALPAAASPALSARPSMPVAQRTADDEAMRLARELRGTIQELLQTRRTVELQRAELAQSATHDSLTGVASRRSILERLIVEVAQSRRYAHPVAVMLLDVDRFSNLNQAHGHTVGDVVLRELALRLRLRMRAADALGRAGGDSFMAILPHTDERGAAVFADAVRQRLITSPIETDAGALTISISIGVAFVRPGMELSADELLGAADEALASAKAAGGNRIGFDRRHGLVRVEERRPSAS